METALRIMVGLISASLIGCSSMSYKKRSLVFMGTGALMGASHGSSFEESNAANTALYAALGLGVGALIDVVTSDADQRVEELHLRVENLSADLGRSQKEKLPDLISQGQSLSEAPLPDDIRKIIRPAQWKRYRLDRWVQDNGNPNLWFKQTEMFEFIPSSLNQ